MWCSIVFIDVCMLLQDVDLTHSRISKIENLEVLFQVEVRNKFTQQMMLFVFCYQLHTQIVSQS